MADEIEMGLEEMKQKLQDLATKYKAVRQEKAGQLGSAAAKAPQPAPANTQPKTEPAPSNGNGQLKTEFDKISAQVKQFQQTKDRDERERMAFELGQLVENWEDLYNAADDSSKKAAAPLLGNVQKLKAQLGRVLPTKPAEGNAETKPAEGNAETKPAEGNAETKPAEGNAETKPAEGNAETPPKASSANVLTGSVGKGGTNNPEEVKRVQNLLNRHGIRPALEEDGKVGDKTIAAIEKFQQIKLNGYSDGLVEPGKNTWKALLGEQIQPVTPPTPQPAPISPPNADGKLLYEDEARAKHGDAFVEAIKALGARIKLNPSFILATMWMESKFDPSEVNPRTGATGLIQFMPDTAAGLGTSTDALRGMSAMQQLQFVEKFYTSSGADPSKIQEPAESYLLVFYPYAVGKPDSYVLGSEDSDSYARLVAQDNDIYDLNGDGYITKGEVVQYQRENHYKEAYDKLNTNQPTNTEPVAPTMGANISASVGDGGANKPEDVLLVKTLINKFILSFDLADASTNTKVGPSTIAAIKKFQQEKVGLSNPDGLIEPGKNTWKVLNGEMPPVAAVAANTAFTGEYNAALGQEVAASAKREAQSRGTVGKCYSAVADAVERVIGGGIFSGMSAYMAAGQMAALPNLFKEVSTSPSSVASLPAGAIIVWAAGGGPSAEYGHITVCLGGGSEASDHIADPMYDWPNGSPRAFLPINKM